MLESVVEPILLRLEADKQTGRFAVPRDHDLAPLGQSQVARQIILDGGERDLTRQLPRARRATPPRPLW